MGEAPENEIRRCSSCKTFKQETKFWNPKLDKFFLTCENCRASKTKWRLKKLNEKLDAVILED
jgi:predicted  nucleic acid-binding Zn ribbon protein